MKKKIKPVPAEQKFALPRSSFSLLSCPGNPRICSRKWLIFGIIGAVCGYLEGEKKEKICACLPDRQIKASQSGLKLNDFFVLLHWQRPEEAAHASWPAIC
jgi:hypothetical protein